MLTSATVYVTLPAVDLKRARKFYEETLDLKFVGEDPSPGVTLQAGNNCMLYLYKRSMTKADHTVAGFDVDDVEVQVRDLKDRGVKFEDYDIPDMELKTVNSVATFGLMKSAWFKDTEGNILAIGNFTQGMKGFSKSQKTVEISG